MPVIILDEIELEQLKPTPDDYCRFWSFEDLVERRIIKSRNDLSRKKALYGFPKPTKLSGDRLGCSAAYLVARVKHWLIERHHIVAAEGPIGRRGRPRKINQKQKEAA